MSQSSTQGSPNQTTIWNSSKSCDYYDDDEVEVAAYLLGVHIVLCVVSFTVGLVNVVVLTRPHMRKSSLNVLLAAIETSNLVIAVSYLAICVLDLAYNSDFHHIYLIYIEVVLLIIAWTAIAFTVWLTGIIGSFRLIAVTWPLKSHIYLTRKCAFIIIISLVCLCFCVITIDFSYRQKIVKEQYILCYRNNQTEPTEETSYYVDFGSPKTFLSQSIVIVITLFIIPSIFCMSVTVLLLWKIRTSLAQRRTLRQLRRNEDYQVRTTAIIIAMLLAYVISNAAPHLTTFLSWYDNKDLQIPPPWDYVLEEFMLGLVVNILSFWGYYYMGTNFRKTFRKVFRKTCYSHARIVCCSCGLANNREDESPDNEVISMTTGSSLSHAYSFGKHSHHHVSL